MNWFSGNITEAVNMSKIRDAIFVVYAEGTDELSHKLTGFINDQKIRTHLESDRFVAIKIESSSEAFMQFSQIYQLVPLPSLFFIGKSGIPIEIVTGVIESIADLEAKIKGILEKTNSSSSTTTAAPAGAELSTESQPQIATTAAASASASFIASESAAPTQADVVCTDGVSVRNPAPTTPVEEDTMTPEQKLEHARALIEKKRKDKEEEERKDAREKEVNRRREGQGMHDLKKWKEEQELKAYKNDRKKEREEEQAERKRILVQIAQDKADREERFSHYMSNPGPDVKVKADVEPSDAQANVDTSNSARIQFKKPDGNTVMQMFNAQDTFDTLRQYVRTQIVNCDFVLATSFPRREFTAEDDTKTLQALGLTPSSVLLILIKTKKVGHSSVAATSGGIFDLLYTMVWNLFTPIMALFTYAKNFAFSQGAPAESGAQKRANEEAVPADEIAKRRILRLATNPTPSTSADNRASGSGGSTTGAYRRVGNSNVHRLRENKDSDDENSTWNGNSTQQM